MRALKLGGAIFVLVDVLLLGGIAGGYLIDTMVFGLARLVTSSQHPDVPLPVVALVGIAVGIAVAVGLHRLLRMRQPRRLVATGLPAALGVLVALGAPTYYADVSGGILVGEVTAAAVAAVRPACTGTAVPAAGHLLTGPGTVNHLAVLDQTGADHDWSGSPPAAWSAQSVGDIELVLCMDREDQLTTAQVCSYNGGSDVTRHTATRAVRVVEASTAVTLATLTVEHPARECGDTEKVDVTDLYGAVEWSDVQAAVTQWLSSNDARTPPESS
jgi:hypothetical protein